MTATSRMTALQAGIATVLIGVGVGVVGRRLGWPLHLSIGGAVAAGLGVGLSMYARWGRSPIAGDRST